MNEYIGQILKGTFATMKWAGYTLNTITLLALALAVGIVIDDAIVVLENIVRHIEEKKETPMVAAVNATKEIGLAVMATTLSLIAVFVPVAFMSGIPGRFLRSFGVTMAFSIAVSLVVSFTLTPMLASRWLKTSHGLADKKPLLERIGLALKEEEGPVKVIGYTDDQPIRTIAFPSNFQLSTARAQAASTIIGTTAQSGAIL